jgi:hypothetical protein
MKAEKVDCGTPVFVKGGMEKASSHIKLSYDINLRGIPLQQNTILGVGMLWLTRWRLSPGG